MKVVVIAGTRPEAIKVAPIVLELRKRHEIEVLLCNSGQHKQMIESLYNRITLYHYTTYETIEKIITGKSIKLSHITEMNDSDEGTALYKYSMSLLEEAEKNGTKKLENNERKILEKDFIDFTSKIFSFSFSALEDDAAQWERYGIKKGINDTNEHCGVRIGIPMLKLMKLIEKIEKEFDLIVIAPILYVPNYEITNSMLDILTRFAMYRTKINSDYITKYISQYSAEIKHTSFKTEYEIRLLIASSSPNFVKINGSILLELEKFDFNNLFSSIMYGPEFAPELKFKMRQLLLKNKIKIKPEDSKCSLRSVY